MENVQRLKTPLGSLQFIIRNDFNRKGLKRGYSLQGCPAAGRAGLASEGI